MTMTASGMIECINAISTWMSSNCLKLNGDKTQFIWMGSRQRLMKIQQTALFVEGAELSPLSSVRDLGFIMDSKLTMSDHVSSVVHSCFFQLRQLRSVRHSSTCRGQEVAHPLFHLLPDQLLQCQSIWHIGYSTETLTKCPQCSCQTRR